MKFWREAAWLRGRAYGLRAVMLAAPCLAGFDAAAQDAPASYSIKRDDPSVGSNIRRNRLTGPLPYDKSYAELSDEQRAQVRSRYETLGETDEPPFPQAGLGKIYDPLSRAQQKLNVVGPLSLVAYIDDKGEATRIEVLSSPSPEMTRLAAMVAMQTRFKPAQCAGAPCAMGFPIRINFTVNR